MAHLLCFECGGRHKARRDKFPIDLVKMRNGVAVLDAQGRQVTGGHVCKKCASKKMVAQRPAGIGWRAALGMLINRQKHQVKVDEFKKTQGENYGNHRNRGSNFGSFLSRVGRCFGLKPA